MKANDWIKVRDRLPEAWTSVLVFTKYDRLYVAYWNGRDWVSNGEVDVVGLAGVTHWTPIVLPNNV